MPYITPIRREFINTFTELAQNVGELNYCFTMEIKAYLRTKGISYQTFNDILGALEGAKLEFNRRIVAPYEDIKIKENGDVY
jgi:hypothetical protein